jgi:hypothetical protein
MLSNIDLNTVLYISTLICCVFLGFALNNIVNNKIANLKQLIMDQMDEDKTKARLKLYREVQNITKELKTQNEKIDFTRNKIKEIEKNIKKEIEITNVNIDNMKDDIESQFEDVIDVSNYHMEEIIKNEKIMLQHINKSYSVYHDNWNYKLAKIEIKDMVKQITIYFEYFQANKYINENETETEKNQRVYGLNDIRNETCGMLCFRITFDIMMKYFGKFYANDKFYPIPFVFTNLIEDVKQWTFANIITKKRFERNGDHYNPQYSLRESIHVFLKDNHSSYSNNFNIIKLLNKKKAFEYTFLQMLKSYLERLYKRNKEVDFIIENSKNYE